MHVCKRAAVYAVLLSLAAVLIPQAPAGAFSGAGTNGLIAIDGGPLFAINPVTGARSQLLGSVAADDTPDVAPSGLSVAFANAGNIFIAEFPGGNNRQQVTTGGGNAGPAYSPDGNFLAFSCPSGICSAPTKGAFPPPVTAFTGSLPGDTDPNYSPDGVFVAFIAAGVGLSRFSANNTGGRTALLGATPGDANPSVLTDGSAVAYDTVDGINTMGWPNGANPGTLTGTVPGDTAPTPSPDGTKLALSGVEGIVTLNLNDTSGRSLVPGSTGGIADTDPSWARATGGTTGANTAPVFSAASSCGGSSILALLPLFGPGTAGVSASDTAGQVVTLTAGGVPGFVSFTTAPGNPAVGTLSINLLNPLEYLNLITAVVLQTPSTVTVTATDNGAPVASATCAKTVRIGIV